MHRLEQHISLHVAESRAYPSIHWKQRKQATDANAHYFKRKFVIRQSEQCQWTLVAIPLMVGTISKAPGRGRHGHLLQGRVMNAPLSRLPQAEVLPRPPTPDPAQHSTARLYYWMLLQELAGSPPPQIMASSHRRCTPSHPNNRKQ